jgi:YggT family protein
MNQGLVFILNAAADIFTVLLLVRVLLQLVKADFYNPISQLIFKLCAPVVEPLRKIFPTLGSFNIAALVAALLIQWSFYLLLQLFSGIFPTALLSYLAVAAFDLLKALVQIYFWGIFILVISSWVGTTNHPTVRLVSQIVDPYMRPFRNLIPPIGMIDISPMVAIFTLMFIEAQLFPALAGVLQGLFS